MYLAGGWWLVLLERTPSTIFYSREVVTSFSVNTTYHLPCSGVVTSSSWANTITNLDCLGVHNLCARPTSRQLAHPTVLSRALLLLCAHAPGSLAHSHRVIILWGVLFTPSTTLVDCPRLLLLRLLYNQELNQDGGFSSAGCCCINTNLCTLTCGTIWTL